MHWEKCTDIICNNCFCHFGHIKFDSEQKRNANYNKRNHRLQILDHKLRNDKRIRRSQNNRACCQKLIRFFEVHLYI